MVEHAEPEQPLNFDLVGYDELGWMPIIGRAADSESVLDLPDGTLRPRPGEKSRRAAREFLANDFLGGQWS